jgi:hypothetical protein
MSGSSVGNLYLNYVSSSVNVRIDSGANIIASGDVVAYSSGTWELTAPVASASALGMIKVGPGLSISNGVLSYAGGGGGTTSVTWDSVLNKPSWIGSSKPSYAWSEITGKPTVLSSISYTTSGSGNVVTNVTASGSVVTVTKGNISTGGSTPTDPWTITGGIKIGGNGDLWVRLSGGNSIIGMIGSSVGNLYLNYVSSSVNVRISNEGVIYSNGNTVSSDMRLKRRLGEFTNVLEKIGALDVFYYTRRDLPGSGTVIGSSAQQMLCLFPEFAGYDPESDLYGIDYSRAGYCLAVSGLKEIASWKRDLTLWAGDKDQKIAELESRVSELETKLKEAS